MADPRLFYTNAAAHFPFAFHSILDSSLPGVGAASSPPSPSPSPSPSALATFLSSLPFTVPDWVTHGATSICDNISSTSLIANSPVALLLFLRLNRLIVPFLLRHFRKVHGDHILRVPVDVADDIQRNPPTSYDTFDESAHSSHYAGRVRDEQHTRLSKAARRIFPDSLARYSTVALLLVGWAVICYATFRTARANGEDMKLWDKILYAGGLLVSGITAEWDTFNPGKNRMPHWLERRHPGMVYVDQPVTEGEEEGEDADV